MQRLIDDLLSYSRMSSQPLQVETLPLSVVVNEVMERLDSVIQENQADISIGSLPELRIDRVLIGQALQNLISNAIKYRGDEPPTITISATASGEE